ncbi:MAG TPA: bifunctional alpha,alpha-trehalose-phosphate synthase (UDP-forming)/trehalose-phosphatase [Puia sp.]|jgi:trehalose 6-phosphate synthase/phosphatase
MNASPARLFIVSSRLPIRIRSTGKGLEVLPSTGELVSAITGFLRRMVASGSPKFTEVGWTGAARCSAAAWTGIRSQLPDSVYSYYPVFPSEKDYESWHQGFANSVLWPLFHYFPSYAEFSSGNYEQYFQVNQEFADTMERYLRPNDTVWIHDYLLLPLAAMLRKKFPDLTIGFFLHIPFPSYEVFRQMPRKWQEEILAGMLGADLVGFQTRDYAAHFLQCVRLVMGVDNYGGTIANNDRLVKTGLFPVSIDFEMFNQARETPELRTLMGNMRSKFEGRKIIFSVDRLDYTKGLIHRIKAYERFIVDNPDFQGKVVFIFVIIPSRDTLTRYAERKRLIDETISTVNGRIGSISWQPFVYIYSHLEFDELITLYRVCDLALITPLRDGMNLIAKEFAASRRDGKGVLVLSELAGASRELETALITNPNDIEEMAKMIRVGLQMPLEEQSHRILAMQEKVKQHDLTAWGNDFLATLRAANDEQRNFQVRFFDMYSQRRLLEAYRHARRRLILLDYDGTLIPFFNLPSLAEPNDLLLEILGNLAGNKKNSIYIVSGRDSATLEKWLGHLPVNLISEHGACFRFEGRQWKDAAEPAAKWKDYILPLMEFYAKKCPGAFIELKSFSIVWHYRNAKQDRAGQIKMELYADLCERATRADLQVMMGNKIIEVRNKGADKGTAIRNILKDEEQDFILAIGDDHTDEDMFRILAGLETAFTIKVGSEGSFAQYNIHTPQMVVSLLGNLNFLGEKAGRQGG